MIHCLFVRQASFRLQTSRIKLIIKLQGYFPSRKILSREVGSISAQKRGTFGELAVGWLSSGGVRAVRAVVIVLA